MNKITHMASMAQILLLKAQLFHYIKVVQLMYATIDQVFGHRVQAVNQKG